MNVAFVFGPNAPMVDFDGTIHLYERSAAMRRAIDQASDWTGLSVEVLLRKHDVPEGQSTMRVNSVTLAAASLAIQDELADLGVVPDVIGGVSLGDMMSAAAAGAMSRRDMITMLYASTHEPASPEPDQEESIAFSFVPAGADQGPFIEPQGEGIWLGSSFGKVRFGDGEAFMLSGYRSALLQFQAEHPEGNVKVRPRHLCYAAYHTPLRSHARDQLKWMLDNMRVGNPSVPLCSSILDQPVTTGAGVRELLLRNCVQTCWVNNMIGQVVSFDPEVVVTIGPAMAKGMFTFPVPVVHVDSVETLADAARELAPAGAARPAA
jgi:[acyl-carrier-protein] S-malonyltransferase